MYEGRKVKYVKQMVIRNSESEKSINLITNSASAWSGNTISSSSDYQLTEMIIKLTFVDQIQFDDQISN